MIQLKHVSTGKQYLLLSKVMIKDAATRAWCPGFAYVSPDKPDKIYTRFAHDFKAHFKAVGVSFELEEAWDGQQTGENGQAD